MHKKFFSWLSLLVVLVSFVAPEAAAQVSVLDAPPAVLQGGGRKGKIMAKLAKGTVTFNAKGSTVREELKNDREIEEGSVVHTGAAPSSVVLLFENGASLQLGDNTDLDIAEFKLDPIPPGYDRKTQDTEPSFSNTDIMLTRGELIGNVKTLKRTPTNNSKFKVSTPVGAAGIRGTVFKIVYRPVGDGRTGVFNFVMTTVEGNVEVVVSSGTVNTPAVGVTNNKEVSVEVNTTTTQVTATGTSGTTPINTAVALPVTDAPLTTVQATAAVGAQLAQQIANVVFSPPPAPPGGTPNDPPKDEKKEEKKDTGTPGSTSKPDSLTPGTP